MTARPRPDQLRLAACGADWVRQAKKARGPLKVTNTLSLEVHTHGDLVRLVEHIPRRRRQAQRPREALRIIGQHPAPDVIVELCRFRASMLDQQIDGKQVDNIAFVLDCGPDQRIAAVTVVDQQTTGSLKKPQVDDFVTCASDKSSMRAAAEYLVARALVDVATKAETKERISRRMASKINAFF